MGLILEVFWMAHSAFYRLLTCAHFFAFYSLKSLFKGASDLLKEKVQYSGKYGIFAVLPSLR